MSTDLLREAAAKMRERAEAATPGPWLADLDEYDPMIVSTSVLGDSYDNIPAEPRYVAQTSYDGLSNTTHNSDADAEHIASWHPAVALAVADWLDSWAEWMGDATPHPNDKAVAVARAYLGRES